ncbi:adenosylcobalamin-dependent ribonucleoside-diphosphate reductase [Candidatus Micrarchaeota archaeon]|nr:adenosylcobalamin-dependent ribonucleoside-diphosphate reductase [Candidatus Micrarchaeota archaeon]
MVNKIKKRDGSIVDFDKKKLVTAIFKAAESVGGSDLNEAEKVADLAIKYIDQKFKKDEIPGVEDIQDFAEKALIERGHAATAKAYIIYRHRKSIERELKKFMGVQDDLKLSVNAVQVLERRYLLKDEEGKVAETPSQLLRRVAKYIASAEFKFGGNESDVKYYENAFYSMMSNFEFMPNSPTLMNAGTELGQLSACFILGVDDNIDSIFDSVKFAAKIHQTGGGTGFCFSFLRPKGDFVKSTAGVASGPISFMTVFDHATNVIKQGGKRRGANMGVLHIWHPDIEEFITVKQNSGMLENFNLSVGVDDAFMEAVEKDGDYDLRNPRTGEPVRKIKARRLFNLIAYSAWKSAEPGVLFMDTINRENPTPEYSIVSTNPCGEVPMPNFESCNLGSINLAKFVDIDWSKSPWKKKINWKRLKKVVRFATIFLDNVVELNNYPLNEIKESTLRHRRIGLGIMGFANMLVKIGIRYGSDTSFEVAEEVMKFITEESRKTSHELGRLRGPFPGFEKSLYSGKYDAMRNATVTSIAPTGTISMIADTSSGIEPLFALAYMKHVMDGTKLYYSNEIFEHILKVRGLYSQELMQKVIESGTIQDIDEIPKDIKDVFAISYDIASDEHVRMQSAFQKNTDLAVSKTINLPNDAGAEDVEHAYMMAWKLGCKGITVYRDGSRGAQVLNIIKKPKPASAEVKPALAKLQE